MSFRARLTLAAAAAVAVAVVGASAVTYGLVRSELRSQVDETLESRAATLPSLRVLGDPNGEQFLGIPPEQFGGVAVFTQLVRADGEAITPPRTTSTLPVSDRARRTARGEVDRPFYEDAEVEGTHVRVLTLPLQSDGYALQVARSLEEVDSVLRQLSRWLIALALVGIALAAGLGLLVARAVLAPVQRLTRTAEEVSETRDLSRRIDASGADELSRLATTFNTMLGALEDSARAQRRLVSDASHELRTPLTSLRTNIEVLARDQA
ncbi:MAG: HAMP domain-containing protein, partial [Gaiellaceae bacterium]